MEETTQPDNPKKPAKIRAELVEFCKSHNLDIKEIANLYKLNNDSPDEDFKKAYNYAVFCSKLNNLNDNKTNEEV